MPNIEDVAENSVIVTVGYYIENGAPAGGKFCVSCIDWGSTPAVCVILTGPAIEKTDCCHGELHML